MHHWRKVRDKIIFSRKLMNNILYIIYIDISYVHVHGCIYVFIHTLSLL